MTSTAPLRLVTPRDIEILGALDLCPLTASQLLTLSRTFALPFTHERRVRERLFQLCSAGRVRRWQYATVGRGAPNYYTLSRLGFRILHGEEAVPPTKRAFEPVAIAKQRHTQALADFIVHTLVAARRDGLSVADFTRENTLRLPVGEEALWPDSGFLLVEQGGQEYGFYVEVDGGTERIRSQKDIDSWERKLRLYDRLQDLTPRRFRVLVVSIESQARVEHILRAAAALVRNPERSLFYGVSLPAYLAEPDPLRAACLQDHRGNQVSLVPSHPPRSRGLVPHRTTLAAA